MSEHTVIRSAGALHQNRSYRSAQTSPPANNTSEPTTYSIEQLDALLAPIALYPDDLLMQVLMASTFPLQVVDASRRIEVPANKQLRGDALTAAVAAKPWDPSVKSLVPFPDVLAIMNGHLDWIQQLGYAMTVQQSGVFDSVQRLRRQADAAGSLKSNAQIAVQTEGPAIVIQPAQPNVVYVPSYNPTVVYGAWPYPSYPPACFPPPPGPGCDHRQRTAAPLPRLFLPHPEGTGSERTGRCAELCPRRRDDRRLRLHCVAG
jgi:hypothetical protein